MSSRGVAQLKRMQVVFSDWGGSSRGMMEFIKTDDFYSFVNNNKQINFEFYLKRGGHPFISAQYANGLKKDIPLRNYSKEQILEEMNKATQQCK